MKKITLIAALILATFSLKAQVTLAGWSFPTGTNTDANPDSGIPANATMAITAQGGTSAIDFSKNGLTTKSAQATGWDGGNNIKYWQINVNTTGYESLTLSSKQTSGGSFPGPRDFKAQYKIGNIGSWTDIPGTVMVTANNWTSAVLTNVSLPSACDNQALVFIRWIMTSDTSSAPPALVLATGTSKIDDINVSGTAIGVGINETDASDQISVYPNPCSNELFMNMGSNLNECTYEIISANGQLITTGKINENSKSIFVGELPPSLYFIRITAANMSIIKKLSVIR